MHLEYLQAAWLLFGWSYAVPSYYSPYSPLRERQDAGFDEYNFSGIQKMAAIGDSYSAGIGAGNRLGQALDIGNAVNKYSDWWCSRYDNSYPYLLNQDLGDLNKQGGKFQFLSCSGAQTKEVIDTQVQQMDGGQDVILISSGGNDVGFADVINQCVYQFFSPTKLLVDLAELAALRADLRNWLAKQTERVGIEVPTIDLAKYARTCEEQLAESKKMIEDASFSKGIADLISKAKAKLAPGGQIYYTSYAEFWSPDATDDDWCASPDHTWSVGLSNIPNVADWQKPIALTAQHRTKMNEFVSLVNQKIFDAILASGGDNVNFVKWDEYAGGVGGHFCRKEVKEPDTTRWNAAFYEWNVKDPLGTTPFRRSNTEIVPGSFEGVLNGLAGAAFQMGIMYKDDGNGNKTDQGIEKRSNFIPDGFGRIFHPTSFMHRTIKDLVGYNMASRNALAHNIKLGPALVFPGNQCELPSGPVAGKCTDNAASGILASNFSTVYDKFCTEYNDPNKDKAIPITWKQEVSGLDDAQADGKTSIEISWVKQKDSNECSMDCTEAFRSLSQTCGTAGGHTENSGSVTIIVGGVQMSKAAEVDVGCGTYNYVVTVPPKKPIKKDPVKTCYKDDANRMKDHHNWKFVEQQKLDDAIDKFCSQDWQDFEDNKPWQKDKSYYEADNDWNFVKIFVSADKGRADKNNCKKNLMEISAGCDWDGKPEDQSANQWNFKWGGEFLDSDGVKWTLAPQRERVKFEKRKDTSSGLVTDSNYAASLGKFSDHDNKGLNGAPLDDKAKMTLQMCAHGLRLMNDDRDFSCGGLVKVGIHRKSYNDYKSCAENTWHYLSYYVEQGEISRAWHRPGFSDCWADFMF